MQERRGYHFKKLDGKEGQDEHTLDLVHRNDTTGRLRPNAKTFGGEQSQSENSAKRYQNKTPRKSNRNVKC